MCLRDEPLPDGCLAPGEPLELSLLLAATEGLDLFQFIVGGTAFRDHLISKGHAHVAKDQPLILIPGVLTKLPLCPSYWSFDHHAYIVVPYTSWQDTCT